METIPVVACICQSGDGWRAELDALLDLDDGETDVRAEVCGGTFDECKTAVDELVRRLSDEHGRPTKVAYLPGKRRLERVMRHAISCLIIDGTPPHATDVSREPART